jgi:ABC-type multidrug transport system ATPase subunit
MLIGRSAPWAYAGIPLLFIMNDFKITDLTFQERGPYTFEIESATVVGLHGASGAGKTLLLRAIADLDQHQGKVQLGEMVCEQVPAATWRKTVGLLSAESFWWFDTVGEHFNVPVQDLEGYLQQLGFPMESLGWDVSRLSTGEKQRLALVRLLQNHPRALLLDEPTASLDTTNIGHMESLLMAYCKKQQVPVLWVSHDSRQLGRVADRVLYLDSDGILQESPRGQNVC